MKTNTARAVTTVTTLLLYLAFSEAACPAGTLKCVTPRASTCCDVQLEFCNRTNLRFPCQPKSRSLQARQLPGETVPPCDPDTSAPSFVEHPVTPGATCRISCGGLSCCADRSGASCYGNDYTCVQDEKNVTRLCPTGSGACNGICYNSKTYKCLGNPGRLDRIRANNVQFTPERTTPLVPGLHCDYAGFCQDVDHCCVDRVLGQVCYNPQFSACMSDEQGRTRICGATDSVCNGTCYDPEKYRCTGNPGLLEPLANTQTAPAQIPAGRPIDSTRSGLTCSATDFCARNDQCCEDYVAGPSCYSAGTGRCLVDGQGRSRLCPLQNGVCNGVCYELLRYSCENTTLVQRADAPQIVAMPPPVVSGRVHPIVEGQTCNIKCGADFSCCGTTFGPVCYSPLEHSCVQDEQGMTQLCAVCSGLCKGQCYDDRSYSCVGTPGSLVIRPVPLTNSSTPVAPTRTVTATASFTASTQATKTALPTIIASETSTRSASNAQSTSTSATRTQVQTQPIPSSAAPTRVVTPSTPAPTRTVTPSIPTRMTPPTVTPTRVVEPTRVVTPSTATPTRVVTSSTATPTRVVTPSTPTPTRTVTPSTPTRVVTPSTATPTRVVEPTRVVTPSTAIPTRVVTSSTAIPTRVVTPSTPTPTRMVTPSTPTRVVTPSTATPTRIVTPSTATPTRVVTPSTPTRAVTPSTPTRVVTPSTATPTRVVTPSTAIPTRVVTPSTPTRVVTPSTATPTRVVTPSTVTPTRVVTRTASQSASSQTTRSQIATRSVAQTFSEAESTTRSNSQTIRVTGTIAA